MKKFYKILICFILILLIAPNLFAEVKISGDARVRPRYDITDNTEVGENKKTDFYYLYRIRLKLAADIGEGWYFKTTLAHNGTSMYAGKFGEGDGPSEASLASAGRASVDFMYAYFGRKTDLWGFNTGIIPWDGVKNPLLDLHFYPTQMVDIPYAIYNNNGTYGFSGYYKLGEGKLNTLISVDDNNGSYQEDADGNELNHSKDQYSLYLDYITKLSDFTIQPMFFATLADDSMTAPMTFGGSITTPKFNGFTFTGHFGYSMQSVEEADEYSAWLFRGKIVGDAGPGQILAWYDMAKKTDKMDEGDDLENDFWYAWLSYKLWLHKSDKGSVTLLPTLRIRNQTDSDDNVMKRIKIELNTDILF